MVSMILFDLDGTLLPMDLDVFLQHYMEALAKKMQSRGYEADKLIQAVRQGVAAMMTNDGKQTNEAVFWNVFTSIFGERVLADMPFFKDFYHTEFQELQKACGFDPRAAETIRQVKEAGYRVALATSPLYPAVATLSRIRWAGLDPADFELITTYENFRHSKPQPEYYQDVMAALDVKPEECLMVGNDVTEDMVAATLGIQVFLLTDCIINKQDRDIRAFPKGSFPELLSYIRRLR
jgi:HAD superfamily hydrolase (TIGR01549 family)